jgi:hypothetical protein
MNIEKIKELVESADKRIFDASTELGFLTRSVECFGENEADGDPSWYWGLAKCLNNISCNILSLFDSINDELNNPPGVPSSDEKIVGKQNYEFERVKKEIHLIYGKLYNLAGEFDETLKMLNYIEPNSEGGIVLNSKKIGQIKSSVAAASADLKKYGHLLQTMV